MAKNKKALIDGLNDDLASELGASILYLHQCAIATGWEGEEIREFLQPEVTEEMGHALFLAEKIAQLGGNPTTMPKQYKSPKSPKEMLKFDLKLELEAIEGYRLRAMQAEEAGEFGLKIKLEEMLLDETGHAEKIQRILKGM